MDYLAFVRKKLANPEAVSSPSVYPLTYYFENRQYPELELLLLYMSLTRSLMTLADVRDPDMTLVYVQTSWQTLSRGALGGWLSLLRLMSILLLNDCLTSEQRHRSIVWCSPLSPWQLLYTKTLTGLTALAGVLCLCALVVLGSVFPTVGLGSLTTLIAYLL